MKFVLSPRDVHALVVISRNPEDPVAAAMGTHLSNNARMVMSALKDLVLAEEKLVTVAEIKKKHTPKALKSAENFLGYTSSSRRVLRAAAYVG